MDRFPHESLRCGLSYHQDGRTALDLATLKGSTDIMECLQRATPKTMTSNVSLNFAFSDSTVFAFQSE